MLMQRKIFILFASPVVMRLTISLTYWFS
jgi:hypothetical protein